jgi:hypothetical protein
MKKIYMQKENDCFTACLATLFQVPYELIPRFLNDLGDTVNHSGHVVTTWEDAVHPWLNSIGMEIMYIHTDKEHIKTIKGYVIVAGLSYTESMKAKNVHHAVIYKDGELWHDPKPYPTGVIEPEYIDLIYPISLIGLAKIQELF